MSKDRQLRTFTVFVPVQVEVDGSPVNSVQAVPVEVRAYTPNAAAERLSRALCDLVERTR